MMKKVDKATLKEAAHKMLFDMSEEEFDSFLEQFDVIQKQIDLISQVDGVDEIEPTSFPYPVFTMSMREDIATEPLSQEEALKNAHEVENGMIKIPKVVEK